MTFPLLFGSTTLQIVGTVVGVIILVVAGMLALFSRFYRKVGPDAALVRSGVGNLFVVTGKGMLVIPVLHRVEEMDISLKRIEIFRKGDSGLICRDNIRADIEVAFFVRVNNTVDDIQNVAQSIGCGRASQRDKLIELFDAKFSEALKTVGKHFDFVELYNERDKFKEEILKVIGTDLNGYVLDDCAIDYLEQTTLEHMNPQNILDAEGIKKITELTSREHILSNDIEREKEKTIKKQDVEAREAILELERQQIEAEQKQEREIVQVTARESSAGIQVQNEERLKAERARIATDEEVAIAEENKMRQVIVAMRNKERTDQVELERVARDQQLEATERERAVTLAQIDKEKAVEVEKRNIQEVIRERVIVERGVVEEQERIKDTHEFATADRSKKVTLTDAERDAQEKLVKDVQAAEAEKQASQLQADTVVIRAEAQRQSADKETQATKMLAEAKQADQAASGLADVQVQIARADATEQQGTAEATVTEKKAVAVARGREANAVAIQKEGSAEAAVMRQKFSSDAAGIKEKANAMKLFDGVGREHEEFKLRLNKTKDIEIAGIEAQKDIADAQATIVGEALKQARIDIVGGETTFFDRIVDSVKAGKSIDRLVHNSETLTDVKNTFFNGNPDYFRDKVQQLVEEFDLSTDDVKDLSIAALIAKLLGLTKADETRSELQRLLGMAQSIGLADRQVSTLNLGKETSESAN
ncbi:MAG TPA: flotillin family protein [Planctomycetes bacterium]|nr:flotillin family protein [Planctomycetota bacterium]